MANISLGNLNERIYQADIERRQYMVCCRLDIGNIDWNIKHKTIRKETNELNNIEF